MYRTTDCSYINDPSFRRLPPITKSVYQYLWSNPHSHVSGIYYLPDPAGTIAHEWGWTRRQVDEALAILLKEQRIFFDSEREVIFVKTMLRRQCKGKHIHNSRILQGVANQLATLNNSPLIGVFLDIYKDLSIPYTYSIPEVSIPPVDPAYTPPYSGTVSETGTVSEQPPLYSPPSRGEIKKTKLPLLKRIEDLEQALSGINVSKFIREFEPQGLDVVACFNAFHEYVIRGSPKKPYPNPSKWRDFNQAFYDACKRSLDKGWYLLTPKTPTGGSWRDEYHRIKNS